MNDAEIDEMQNQVRRETEQGVDDGGISVPDGGDGITRYPQDSTGAIVTPTDMPDFEKPEDDKGGSF